ncbi:MAG: DoxX family protein, partial [Sphingobacterium sp.]
GIWKILAVVALLSPRRPLLKEWAYAGIFFTVTGALYSHIVVGDSVGLIAPALLYLLLIAVSWYFRPSEKKFLYNH